MGVEVFYFILFWIGRGRGEGAIQYLDTSFLEFLNLDELGERDIEGRLFRFGLAPYDFREPSSDGVCQVHVCINHILPLNPQNEDVLSSLLITALSLGLSSPSALAARACRLRVGSTSGTLFVVVAAPLANALPFVAKLWPVRRDAEEAERCGSPLTGASGVAEEISGRNREASDGPRERFPESSLASMTRRIGLGSAVATAAVIPLEFSNWEPRASDCFLSMSSEC